MCQIVDRFAQLLLGQNRFLLYLYLYEFLLQHTNEPFKVRARKGWKGLLLLMNPSKLELGKGGSLSLWKEGKEIGFNQRWRTTFSSFLRWRWEPQSSKGRKARRSTSSSSFLRWKSTLIGVYFRYCCCCYCCCAISSLFFDDCFAAGWRTTSIR